ncbi:hypothetical protein CVT24_004731 [Panaeolus cyanescens]|uniref:Anti-proliferative protein domain-containing protein n=1 Tax=Panaeolus cyanescens TaxID=181874 RepID=A0A409V9R2_9AGAR|nr:hypothetical protein CVT24_004731 [Panaeolus cyanescens]
MASNTTTSSSMSLSLAVAHVISFLTAKLPSSYSSNTLLKLQMVLEANLTAHYAPSWVPAEPVRGSGRRCMTLSPACLPPRPIWSACAATGVQWFDWIASLGNNEFDLFVDPGCVAIRIDGTIVNVWCDDSTLAAPMDAQVITQPIIQASLRAATRAFPSKTVAQQLVEADKEEEEQIFALLNDEITAPTWVTPIITQFPIPARSTSPLSSISEQSRCSSRSSNSSSSTFSLASSDAASRSKNTEFKQSRRERARQARVFVDTTKTDVTPYDGGKTTVLTGGVMLGGGPKAAPKSKVTAPAMNNTTSWRSVRV